MKSSGINLFFSHSVERLADVLSVQLSEQQQTTSIFEAPQVLVPNANMQRYLQLTVAKNNGICAHVDFPFLETGLFQTVNQLLGSQYHHLNGSMVSWAVWQLLLNSQLINEPTYAPIKTYLKGQGSEKLQATKHWQLSHKLAKLMLDYESQRPEMIDLWLQGETVFHGSKNRHLKQLEQMQQDLYVRLFNTNVNQSGITLFQAALMLDKVQTTNKQHTLHVFTPSRLSQLHRKILVQLGRFMNVHIYSLNVCSEYWEDLQTEQEVRWQQRLLSQYKQHAVTTLNSEGLAVESTQTAEIFAELTPFVDENELLKAWGKPGREALKLFSYIEEDAIHKSIPYQDDWLIPDLSSTGSLLHVVQSNVLNRTTNAKQIVSFNSLSSVQFACAPSITREVEAVYNSLLWNLEHNPDLALNEVAILVTDMNAYRFVIEQVFEELNHEHGIKLSYAIVDSSAATESRYAEAVFGLFTVLEDDFIRASVFKWLDNPCVQAGNHFDQNDWKDWLLVVDHLGIYCGFSILYDAIDDSVDADKLFTWEQGLSRLYQSLAISSNDESLDVSAIGAEKIGQLGVLLETLHQYKVRLSQEQTTVKWEQQLNQLFDLLIAVPADDQKEQIVQMALQQSLLKLAEAQPEMSMNFEDIKQFITHEIQQLPASKGSYLSGGVVCAALQPMRPIPFKLTYILGMDEKAFPGQIRHETLDLTQKSRRIGDINTIENNNYLLLETLMCTREKLYVSYVGMDLLKDEVIEPSPTFTTLYRYCHKLVDYSAMQINHLPVYQLPLDASESIHFDGKQLDIQDWGVNYAYSDYLLWADKHVPNWQPEVSQLSPAQQQVWQSIKAIKTEEQQTKNSDLSLVVDQVDNAHLSASSDVLSLDSKDLADYLNNPQVAVLKRLGVDSKHPEDHSLLEHEPHKLSPLHKHEIFTASIQQWLNQSQTADLIAIIKQQHQKLLLRSKAPMALFAELTDLSKVQEQLQQQLGPELVGKQPLGLLKMGRAKVQMSPDLAVEGIELVLDSGLKIQLEGVAEQLYQQGGYLTDQVVVSSSTKDEKWNKKLLKPFINWCLWQLSDQVKVAEVFRVHLVFPKKIETVEFKPWYADGESFATRSTIENYLKQLVSHYVEKQAWFLPSELLNLLKVDTKTETVQKIPFLKTKSKAKSISYLAYDQSDLTELDIESVVNKYAKELQWPSYEEILKLIDTRPSQQPLLDYRQNLLPLFTMVFGEFEHLDPGVKL